ncbi:FRG domain-containing protein [Flavobacterium acetivorans]|uniref:FRG domain-containing protein n=1 Tax=Flavobacterium acetivorans TaxID=2893883 RepID=UPI001E4496E7|nr:FRG domain-containing protein [Flavobacterium sp. F-29]UFH34539.1 FRG domain-containing protein [Flavobacterium sp. F-29]
MTKTLTIRIKNFKDLLELSSLPFYWRGHSNAEWPLQTNLERQIDKTSCVPSSELRILREFKRKQHLYESSKDIVTNDFERIAKIQHHGGPTRLLDFTKSLLVASYFCTEDFDDKNDGAIWGINISNVNGAHSNPEVEKMLIELIFGQSSDLFSNYLNGKLKEQTVVFIEPFLLNHRLQVQQGLFAIPLDVNIRFIDNLNSLFGININDELSKNIIDFNHEPLNMAEDFIKFFECSVIKIIIPKEVKRAVKLNIKGFGVKTEMIYPDIDGFCKSLVSNCEDHSSTFKFE